MRGGCLNSFQRVVHGLDGFLFTTGEATLVAAVPPEPTLPAEPGMTGSYPRMEKLRLGG